MTIEPQPPQPLLAGKSAVIYGGAGTIGAAVAHAFAAEGASVHLVGRTRESLETVAARIRGEGGAVETAVLDALDEQAVRDHCDAVATDHGSLDISMNVVSFAESFGVPLAELDVADYQRPIVTATTTTFLTAKAAARHMVPQRSGVILMFGGYGVPLPNVYFGGFQIALSAVDSLREQLAGELGPHGIRVMTLQSAGVASNPEEGSGIAARTMLMRAPTPEDVGDVAAFAASDRAGMITGTSINLTAGAELH